MQVNRSAKGVIYEVWISYRGAAEESNGQEVLSLLTNVGHKHILMAWSKAVDSIIYT